MARILIFVTGTQDDPGGNMVINGQAMVEGGGAVTFDATPAWGSTPTAINQAIEDAAVASAVAAGHNITAGANDRITLAAAKAL